MHRALLAAGVFFSAFLLFQVQPLAAKVILPWFGGTAGVWAVSLLFFQSVLWLGYLYAHVLVTNFSPARQAAIHSLVVAASLLTLPIAFRPVEAQAAVGVLAVLAAAIGAPYFVLSATGPIVQAWYAASNLGVPYRLFALSNLASLGGLLAYPFLIEPNAALSMQLTAWSAGYAATCALLLGAAVFAALRGIAAPARSRAGFRVMWFLLPACASSLLVGITTHLTQNVSPAPLLWIVPLGLYLLSFVLTFDREGWYTPDLFRLLLSGALFALAIGVLRESSLVRFPLLVGWLSGAFFLCCVFLHGELARLKPLSEFLTSYYLSLAFGGACGGIFAGLLAPFVFPAYYEIPLTLLAVSVLAARLEGTRLWAGLSAALAILLAWGAWQYRGGAIRMDRNFYGVVRVVDDRKDGVRALMHGSVNHGQQFVDERRMMWPTAYYGRASGIGVLLQQVCAGGPCRVGVIGLGAGTLAAYARAGDTMRFYEIDPAVIDIARRDFRFLTGSDGRIEIVPGDGRISLAGEPPMDFDVLVVDAFSGDSIPVHLLTREAAELYRRHLKPNGVLALHVTNNYLDLPPLVRAVFGGARPMVLVRNPPEPENGVLYSAWVLTGDRPSIGSLGEAIPERKGLRPWTDGYSNLLSILR